LQDLKRALAKLPDEQQSALLLAGMEGTRYDESCCRSRRAGRLATVVRPRSVASFDGHGDGAESEPDPDAAQAIAGSIQDRTRGRRVLAA
jgi:hypothetical protein